MRLLKASIENFLIIKKAEVPLDAKALVLVLGYSSDGGRADSNGVGKSSLFEAVCWCLYGKTYKGISHDDVVNNRCKGGTRVSLDLLVGKDEITVVRHRQHSKQKNKLLIFKNGDNVTPFSQKDAEIVLQSLIPLSYSAFKHVCYFGQGMADKFLALNDSGRKQLLEELLGMEVYSEAEKKVKVELRELKNTELKLLGKREVLEDTITADEKKLAEFRNKRFEALNKITEERAELVINKVKHEEALEIAQTRLEVRGKLKDSFSDKLGAARKVLSQLEREERDLEIQVVKVASNAMSLKKTMDKVRNLQMCSECEQEVPEDHTEARLVELQEELDVIKLASRGIQEKIRGYGKPLEDAEELVDALEQKLESIDVTTPLLEVNRLSGQIQRIGEIEAELDLREEALKAPSQGLVEALEEAREDLAAVGVKLDEIEQRKPYLEFWEKGFSTTGVRSILLDDVIVYLNGRMNHHSRAISDGEISIQLSPQTTLKSGGTREKMSVNASTGGAGYKAASGGQQRRMDLAVHFALSDLTSTVTGHRVNLLICDEVLDCIDETGTDAILTMLEEKTRRGMTVFLIDHTDAVKDNVNNVLVVSQVNGVSTAELTNV